MGWPQQWCYCWSWSHLRMRPPAWHLFTRHVCRCSRMLSATFFTELVPSSITDPLAADVALTDPTAPTAVVAAPEGAGKDGALWVSVVAARLRNGQIVRAGDHRDTPDSSMLNFIRYQVCEIPHPSRNTNTHPLAPVSALAASSGGTGGVFSSLTNGQLKWVS